MSEAHKIDRQRPMSINGSVNRDLFKMTSHPIHELAMDLAQEKMNPAFLRLGDPVEEAHLKVSAGEFLNWLDPQPEWAAEFYADLLGMSQTLAAEPLLTTWLRADRFWSMLEAGRGTQIIDQITSQVRDWKALGLDDVVFDFYEISPKSVSAKREDVDEPVTA